MYYPYILYIYSINYININQFEISISWKLIELLLLLTHIILLNTNISIICRTFAYLQRSERTVRFRIHWYFDVLSIPWNNIHIAVGGIVRLSAMFTGGSRPISAKPSSPDVRRRSTRSYEGIRRWGPSPGIFHDRTTSDVRTDESTLRFTLHSFASPLRPCPCYGPCPCVRNNVTPS